MIPKKSVPIGTDGQPMTTWQIWLRRLCIFVIVWAALELLFALTLIVAPYFIDVESFAENLQFLYLSISDSITLLSVSSLVGAFFNTVIGFLGIRGAENPSKITLFFWITLIDAVLTAWALASNISVGIIDPAAIVSGLFIIALAICAWQVRKQTGYFDQHP